MILDKKGRLFGLVSIIDIFVLGTVGLIGAFAFFSLGGGVGVFETPTPITMTFTTTQGLEAFTTNSVFIGDTVSDHGTGIRFGEVINIEKTKAIEYHPNRDGIFVPSEREDRYDVNITTRFYGFPVDNGVWINGNIQSVGRQTTLWIGNTSIFMRISHIETE